MLLRSGSEAESASGSDSGEHLGKGAGERSVECLGEQLGPVARRINVRKIRTWKDPVAGDGGCTSNRATRTVTRDRRFANSISAIGTRIYLSPPGVVTVAHSVKRRPADWSVSVPQMCVS